MLFCDGDLRHLQDGQSFNSEGHLEVSRIALEELIQNSLVHREMLGTDVVKLLIFDNRIVIESPGCLPGDLTVDKIKLGWAEMRNPLTAQLCAKTMPYRGLGSGITRALKSGERIDLVNDIERDKFVATIWRDNVGILGDRTVDQSIPTEVKSIPTSADSIPTTEEKVYQLIKTDPKITKEEMAKALNMSKPGIKKNIDKLVTSGWIKCVGTFGGHWEILDDF